MDMVCGRLHTCALVAPRQPHRVQLHPKGSVNNKLPSCVIPSLDWQICRSSLLPRTCFYCTSTGNLSKLLYYIRDVIFLPHPFLIICFIIIIIDIICTRIRIPGLEMSTILSTLLLFFLHRVSWKLKRHSPCSKLDPRLC